MNIPCVNCLVFPMCKARAKDNEFVFNLSAQFSNLKSHCDLLQEEYYEYNRMNPGCQTYPRSSLPYAKQPYPKAVLSFFQLDDSQSLKGL